MTPHAARRRIALIDSRLPVLREARRAFLRSAEALEPTLSKDSDAFAVGQTFDDAVTYLETVIGALVEVRRELVVIAGGRHDEP